MSALAQSWKMLRIVSKCVANQIQDRYANRASDWLLVTASSNSEEDEMRDGRTK